MMDPMSLGMQALNGHPILLKPEQLRLHGMFVGSTRRGKSIYLEHFARKFLEAGIPSIVIDPHGDTVRNLLSYATDEHLEHKVIYIDPNLAANGAVFPLNFLRPNGLDVSTHAGYVMQAIAKAFGEHDSGAKPRLERRERAALMALIEAGYTIAEMLHFLSINDNSFRQHVLSKVQNPYVRAEWEEFDSIARRADREMLVESVLNRAAKIVLNDPIRRCLGADGCGLDWDDIVRSKKTVLVNLQDEIVDKDCMKLLGVLILHDLVAYGSRQTRPLRNPLYVLCDELDELASPDFAAAMQALGKRDIWVWGFVQYLEQLREKATKLYHSMMSNCDLKVAFHTSYDDAKLLVRELFAGEFRGDVTKHEIYHTALIPRETIRHVLSKTDTESSTAGSSNARAMTHAQNITYGPRRSVSSMAFQDANTLQHASNESLSTSHAISVATVPFYEYIERMELSGKAYYSIDELVEQYIAYIQCQPQRHAHLKIRDERVVPVITPIVQEPAARAEDVAKLINRSNRRHAISIADVDETLRGRIQCELPAQLEVDPIRWEQP